VKQTILKRGDRRRTKQLVGEASMTQQNLAAETDINAIMSKYQKHGILTHVSKYAGQYGDFSGVHDYKTGLERVMAANEMFESLPANIRDRFGNDPAKFIDFAVDPENVDEMRALGLAPKKVATPEPQAPADPPLQQEAK